LLDPGSKVAREYEAKTTPHMFVIDKAGRVVYMGGIDDRPYADPASLKSMAYRSSQQTYEIQTAESRYLASLGPESEVFIVGTLSSPYDPVTTRYLVPNQKWTMLKNPAAEIPTINAGNKGLTFLFFPGNEQYRELIHKLCPGGTDGEATTKRGRHLFYAYQLTPAQPQSIRN